MRPYGPGQPQPYGGRGRERAAAAARYDQEEDDDRSPSPSTASDLSDGGAASQQSGDEGSVTPPARQQPPRQQAQDPAAFRPWTLPHVDARYGRHHQRPAQEEGGDEYDGRGTRVVVHSTVAAAEPAEHQQQQQQDVWSIRPRAGSGRTSLNRRRRYDSYVGTLDAHALERLDEEILQSAAVMANAGALEAGGYGVDDEDDDGADVYGGRTPLPSQPRRRRPRQEQLEAEAQRYYEEQAAAAMAAASSPARRSASFSPRRQIARERLCEDGALVARGGGGGSPRLSSRLGAVGPSSSSPSFSSPAGSPSRRSTRRFQRGAKANAAEDDYDEDDVDEQDMQDGQTDGRRRARPASSASHGAGNRLSESPLRKTRAESLSRRAPPPDPTFHDPKKGPPQLQLEDGGAIPDSDDHPYGRGLGSVRVGGDGGGEGGEVEWDGQGQPVRRSRKSSVGLGVGWLYGESTGAGMGSGKRTLLHWLDERLPRMSDKERVARAAVYLSDAIDTRPVRMRGGGRKALFAYRLRTRGAWVRLLQALAVAHLLLALWEPPRALPDDALYHDSVGRHARTGAASAALRLLGLEVVLILLFALDLALEVYALGVGGFFGVHAPMRVVEGKGRGAALQAKLWGQARFALVVLFFADACLSLDRHATSPRFSRPFRPLYLICLSETLKRWSVLLVQLLLQLRDVALGTGILLGLFSLLGLLLFSETGYYSSPSSSSLPYANFDDLLNSGVALYVLMTTQNFGALLNPAYAHSPLYFFFFMAFVLAVVLFLAHLALPRVFWVYHSFQRRQAYDSRLLERLALVASFRCLDGAERKGWVDLASFRALLRYARPDVFDLRTGYERDCYCGATEHMFGQLAQTHPARIYAHEFLRAGLCEVILTDYYPAVPTLDAVGAHGPTASERHQRERARWRAILGSGYADAVAMALLLLCCFFLAFYGSPAMSKGALRGFAYFVVLAFTAEVALKLWAFGVKPFFRSAANALDFLIVGAAFGSLLAYAFAPPHSPMRESQQMANLCLLFLALRLVRLFPRCPIFRKFASAFRVLPFFLSSFALCTLLAYAWAVLGLALFARYGDRVAAVAAAGAAATGAGAGSGEQQLASWAAVNNFSCFWSASVTLFQVATTYDWQAIMYLWMSVTRTGWTALYFISFHLLANVLVFQLTAALFVDAFLAFHDKRWVEGGEDEAAAGAAGQGLGEPGPDCGGGPGSVAFGRVGDLGDGKRWSGRSEVSAAPSAPSPTPSEAVAAVVDVEAGIRGGGGSNSNSPMRRSASAPMAARRRGGGPLVPTAGAGALPHSASYTASVI